MSLDYANQVAKRIKTLPGKKMLIPGNHDKNILPNLAQGFRRVLPCFVDERFAVLGEKYNCTLCHYPMQAWLNSCAGTKHFFGHVHGMIPPSYNRIDVGVDVWGFRLVEIEELIARMHSEPKVDYPF